MKIFLCILTSMEREILLSMTRWLEFGRENPEIAMAQYLKEEIMGSHE